MNKKSKSFTDYIYKLDIPFSYEKYERVKSEVESLLLNPLKVIALLVTISGVFALVFEVKYFVEYSTKIYTIRLIQTLIGFVILVFSFTKNKKRNRVFLVHILLLTIVIVSALMIYLIPTTFQFNSHLAGLVIFTSALFLSWEVKNQIIVAIYYNLVFAFAILFNNSSIFILPNMFESVIFVLLLGALSVIASAANFKMRMELAEKSFRIEKQEKQFHSLFDNSAEGIFQSTQEGKFIIVNSALVKMLGYESEEELISINIVDDLYSRPEDRKALNQLLQQNGEVKNYRIILRKKDGKKIIVSLNDRLVYDEDTNSYHYQGNMHDITKEVYLEKERQSAEEALRLEKDKSDKLANEATQASKAKSTFLANMSHEIRTPMNGVLGYLELVEQEIYDNKEELKDFISKARSAASSLLDIINNLLDISKIEAGRMELEEIDFSPREVVEESLSIISSIVDEKNVKIKSRVEEDVPAILMGDPIRLRQIFSNLLGNAIKFTQKGEISVNISKLKIENGYATILASVRDSGIGIPKDKIDLLFKPFSQIDVSYKRLFGGTGLGLRICREFVHLMNGEINVESTEGVGSNFYFTARLKIKELPGNVKSENKSEKISERDNRDKELKSQRAHFSVLIVDDNEIDNSIETKVLEEAGYNVTNVRTGKEAISCARENFYDLITMDIRMPELDGFETTKAIRAISDRYLNVPIIVITALAIKEEGEKFLAEGMDDVIFKPFKINYYLEKIDSWLKVQNLLLTDKRELTS
jgi:PAS domain S-box-containing protein